MINKISVFRNFIIVLIGIFLLVFVLLYASILKSSFVSECLVLFIFLFAFLLFTIFTGDISFEKNNVYIKYLFFCKTFPSDSIYLKIVDKPNRGVFHIYINEQRFRLNYTKKNFLVLQELIKNGLKSNITEQELENLKKRSFQSLK